MSVESMPQQPDAAALSAAPRRRRRRMPRRFFVGAISLYAMVLGVFLLSRSSLQHALPNIHTIVPTLAAISFYVAANLFLLILGRGHVSRWIVLLAVMTTFVLTSALALTL